MELRLIGTAIFIILMALFVRFAWKKSERDWEYMQESNRNHAEWMVQFGRDVKRNGQMRGENDSD